MSVSFAETKRGFSTDQTPTDMNQTIYMAPQPSYTLGKSLPDSIFSLLTTKATADSPLVNAQPAPTTSAIFVNSDYKPEPSLAGIAPSYSN